ncbi:response regulator [Deinococcus hopiensis]|uniref:Response regulator containing CheY-like receiver, AAA-type ATPase, and DNA-binding domains n=1 Tax=Deinococcus hopiensis KR-140 TaxID=695939 RepID=A0A1W1UF36_9DEIO|nr:response regulator [Deinococcus hopiensis]SMB79394.1 Response regulator containing CheY-like receiver, AAA-type ATPase, and DNA-binding domains [Deinococcus hopiensis KR-140]
MALPQHFLLVDDNVGDQLLAEEAFHHLCPDCTLTCVSSGEVALELLRSRAVQPEVILLDVNMPGLSGFDVLQALKADPELAVLPVIMLSTSKAKGDVEAAYTLHASSYIVKAHDFDAFLKQIDTFLAYWRSAQLTRQ